MADPFLADPHIFETQVAILARRARVVTLDDVLDHVAGGQPMHPSCVHLSIDGSLEATLAAAEVLSRHRLPWTYFPTAHAVLDQDPPWPVRLADAVAASTNALDADGSVHDLGDRTAKRSFFRRAVTAILAAPDPEHALDRVLGLRGMAHPQDSRWPLLPASGLLELAAGGVTIGSRGACDIGLTGVGEARLRAEVAATTRLREYTGQPMRYFAYPFDRHNRAVRRAVAETHALAVSGPGAGWGESRYRLSRFDTGASLETFDAALYGDRRPIKATRLFRRLAARVDPTRIALAKDTR